MRRPLKFNPLGMLIPVVVLACLGAASGKTCESREFWSSFFNKCMNCTDCVHPDIVITPCQGHRDTICGPLSDLKIDWSWMKHGGGQKTRPVKEMTETFKENMQEIKLHEMHVQQKEKLLQKLEKNFKSPDSEVGEVKTPVANPLRAASEAELWDKLKAFGRERNVPEGGITNEIMKNLHKPKILSENPKIIEIPYNPEPWKAIHFNSEEARELLKSASKDEEGTTPLLDENLKFEHDVLVKKFGFFPLEDETEASEEEEEVSEREMDFSATERVILDYQTGVLYLAVGSVVVFFAVALCYSLKHMRTWGSRNYSEDLEELQFWLTSKKKNLKKPLPSTIYKTTTEVVSKGTKGQCKYLERIISKNGKKKMNRVPDNVYQGPHPCMEARPLTGPIDDPEIHKPYHVLKN